MYAGTCLAVDPADLKPRSNLSIALGCIPHLIILAFAVIVVWTAKPSSSKIYKQFTPPSPNPIIKINDKSSLPSTGLFSWHPTLMTLAVSPQPPNY